MPGSASFRASSFMEDTSISSDKMDVKKIIMEVFKPKKEENFIILNDFPELSDVDFVERKEMAEEWYNELVNLSKELKFTVEPVITYLPTMSNSAPLPKKAMQNSKEIDLSKKLDSLSEKDIVLAMTKYSATGPLGAKAKKQKFRVASMPSVKKNMSAFEVDYEKLRKKCYILKERLDWADTARVVFSTGHECVFDLRGRKGIADAGECFEPGQVINLPSGEAFISPYEGLEGEKSRTEGEIAADVKNEIVVYKVKNGKITDVLSKGKESERMKNFFEEDSARRYIAEFAFGCNDKAKLIGNVLQDKKIGFHWAYGYNKHFGGLIDKDKFKSEKTVVHEDNVYAKSKKVEVKKAILHYEDGEEVIMENSKYVKGLFGKDL